MNYGQNREPTLQHLLGRDGGNVLTLIERPWCHDGTHIEQLSDPARETRGLQPERGGRVRRSVLGLVVIVADTDKHELPLPSSKQKTPSHASGCRKESLSALRVKKTPAPRRSCGLAE